MNMDRDLQRKILAALKHHFPSPNFSQPLAESLGVDHRHLVNNACYLMEHGLLEGRLRLLSDGSTGVMPIPMTITAKGLDFLEEDGGLSAILGVVTVKLHADTIRDLIAAEVEKSDLDSSAKAKLITAVKNLPAKSLEEVVAGLAREGLARMPGAIHWLQTLVFPG